MSGRQAMRSAAVVRPGSRFRVLCRTTALVHAVLLLVTALVLVAAASWVPAVGAVPFRQRGGTIDAPVTVGYAVDSVLLDGVLITNGVPVVFDIAAMLPGALRIDLKNCTCEGGAQIYVLGHRGEPPGDRSVVMGVSGLSGVYCSLVFAHNMPARTMVTIRDSRIETLGPVSYAQLGELASLTASPLVLHAALLMQTQLRVSNTVLRTSVVDGAALHVGGGVLLRSSAVVLDGVSLEALGSGSYASAMYVPPSSTFSIVNGSVFSVTNVSVRGGGGFLLGDNFTLSRSVLRFVGVEGRAAGHVVHCDGGRIDAGGWLDLYHVFAMDGGSSVASLSAVTLDDGVVSLARCVVPGATLAFGPSIVGGVVSVQCNRASGSLLSSGSDYSGAGLPSVSVVSCDTCAGALRCFGALTELLDDCACKCGGGGVGGACLPFDVPLRKSDAGGGVPVCRSGVTVTRSVTVGGGQATACFDTVVFSGPITVTVDLRAMDHFADMLNVTLRDCLLMGGAQLHVEGVDETELWLLPRVHVEMTNVTSREGTIVLRRALPQGSSVLLANSALSATVGGSRYVPTTTGQGGNKYGSTLVLDGVRLLSTRFVLTRTTLTCGGGVCAPILVEHGLNVSLSSVFYMDNCAASSQDHVILALASDLTVSNGSVLSIQSSSWRAPSKGRGVGAMTFERVAVSGGSVLQFAFNNFRLGFAMFSAVALTVEDASWLVHRNNSFRVANVMSLPTLSGVYFRNQSVWSILNNDFMPGAYSSNSAYMANSWSGTRNMDVKVYGMCNRAKGAAVTDYVSQLNLQMTVVLLACNVCARPAVCFDARASGISGCKCVCDADGHGDACLPAAVPDSLGPGTQHTTNSTELHCVHGGVMDSVGDFAGESRLCFVGVTFARRIQLNVDEFGVSTQKVNITFLQCIFSGLEVKGNGAAVHVNVTSSLWKSGQFSFTGGFGTDTEIVIVGNVIESAEDSGIDLSGLTFWNHSRLLIFGNRIVAKKYALYFGAELDVSEGGINVVRNTLSVSKKEAYEHSAVYIYKFLVKKNGYVNIEGNSMNAYSGVYSYYGGTLEGMGLFRVAHCTFNGKIKDYSALLLVHGKLYVQGGAQLRVVNNTLDTAYVMEFPAWSPQFTIEDPATLVVIANNKVVNGNAMFYILFPYLYFKLTLPARFVAVCNQMNGVYRIEQHGFPDAVTVVGCGTCNKDAACYMPETQSVNQSQCACVCKGGRNGASCLPFAVPKTSVPPVPKDVVDESADCVMNETLTEPVLNMWKTHHCYVGVTFSGRGAAMRFLFAQMPLHLFINITFYGCTFRDGAALHFLGDSSLAVSAGVSIRVSHVVMHSSVVSFSNTFPRNCDVVVEGVDAVQSNGVELVNGYNDYLSVVSMCDLVLTASSLLVSNVNADIPADVTSSSYGVYSTGQLRTVDGSSLYVRYCKFNGYTKLMHASSLYVGRRSVFALMNNLLVSGVIFFDLRASINVLGQSVVRIVGNRVDARHAIGVGGDWNIQELSWLDLRDNDVGQGAMFEHLWSFSWLNISGDSVVTLTGCTMNSTGLGHRLLGKLHSGYRFVAGCLTIAGRVVTTAAGLERNFITNVTTVARCDECSKDNNCFAVLTSAVTGCVCECAVGGHGDVCVPAPVPEGLLPPPPPPPPPPPQPVHGECMSDMVYPEVAQFVGSGLSWLCYRNVTFRGDLMRLTVAVGAMTGDAANVTFDGCTWTDGAVLLLDGSADAVVRSLSITITGNTFKDALLSVEGAFPARTNITISGNHFSVTRAVGSNGPDFVKPSCVAMGRLVVTDHSTVTLSRNTFHLVAASSHVIRVGDGGLAVSLSALFAVIGNTFMMEGAKGTPIYFSGSFSVPSLSVQNSSAVVVRSNVAVGMLADFVVISGELRVESLSAVVLRGNSVQTSGSVFRVDRDAYLFYGSWMQMSDNLCSIQSSLALFRLSSSLGLRGSTVALSGNRFVSTGGVPFVMFLSRPSSDDNTNGSIVLACNTLDVGTEVGHQIVRDYNVTVLSCSDPCLSAASCFPARTTGVAGSDCACLCTAGGHGDSCLPVSVRGLPGGAADSCVRDVRLEKTVDAGVGASTVCYVGVTFAADVVLDLSVMSGSVRNVTLVNCTMAGGASLYVLGWSLDPPAGTRVDVLISGLVSQSGGGMLVAKSYPPGSRVTIIDTMLVAQRTVPYGDTYDLGGASACLVLYDVKLTGSVMTIARTQVVATFGDAVGLLVVGGIVLPSRGALYVNRLSVQTALGLCVSVVGGVAASDGSVLSFADSDFLLCKHAVLVQGAVNVSGSVVAFVRSSFASVRDCAVEFRSTVVLTAGSLLLVKSNVHDSVTREMMCAVASVTAEGSTLSFVRNKGLFSRMLSVGVSLDAGAHMRVACNRIDGTTLATAEEYAAAGFGDAGSIDVVACDSCDRDAYCYAPGTSSASWRNGKCVCACGDGGYGEGCVPVARPALPAVRGAGLGTFALENATVLSSFVVPKGAREVVLRHVVLDGVHPVIYVPWMTGDHARIVVQNVSLRNGAVLYVMGGTGMRRGGPGGSDGDWAVELSVCGVEASNGALALTGTFPARSALTITDSLLVTSAPTPLVYLPDSLAGRYAPALVLSSLRLVQSVLLVSGVSFVTVVTGGRSVVADGAALRLVKSGIALDWVVFGGQTALHVDAPFTASGGAVLRVSRGLVHAARGFVFDKSVVVNSSAVVLLDNIGTLDNGALLTLQGSALFVSGSWLSVRGNAVVGGLLTLSSFQPGASFVHSTLALYGNNCSGSFVMAGSVVQQNVERSFVVGCLGFNGRILQPMEYVNAGISGETRTVLCDDCDTDVSCFAALTRSTSPSICGCHCAEGGYGRECLPVAMPRVHGCNRTPTTPPAPAPSFSSTATYSVTPSISPPVTSSVSPPTGETPTRPDVACPALVVTTTAAGGRLTQSDIRYGSGAPVLLLVALPSEFLWASGAAHGEHLTFVLGSYAQPNGFSGPWGAMLRNATWRRSATNPRRVLELEVPVYGGYHIGADETIFVSGDTSVISGGCGGVVLGSFVVVSNTPPSLVNALSVINGAVAGATAVALVVSGGLGSMLEIQTLGMFAKMSCASAPERASSVVPPYFLSVFVGLDPVWMVVGNALIAAAFGCVHYGLTVVYQRLRGMDTTSAWAAMRFPSLTYLVAYLMQLGIFFGSVFMLAMPGARVQHYVVGAAGLLCGAAFPVCVCYFIANHNGASFTKYWQFAKNPFYKRWLYPIGYWHPAAQQQMYGSMFTSMKGSYVYWCVFRLFVLYLVGLVASMHPPVERCHVLYFCMAAVLLVGAGVVAFTNMMRSAFLTTMHTAGFVLLAVLCLVNAANYLSPNDGGVRAYAAIVLLLMTMLLATSVYSAVVWYLEGRHWRSLRKPQQAEVG